MVEARSVNVKTTTTTAYFRVRRYLGGILAYSYMDMETTASLTENFASGRTNTNITDPATMALSAAAQEAIGFSDDQFMDLSTSGASFYHLPLLDTSISSSKLNQHNSSSSRGTTSPSLLKVLLASSSAKAKDESSLSASGMSLASLGALSRSARRQSSGFYNVDEALDDSIAWRETWLMKVADGEEDRAHSGQEKVSTSAPRKGTDVGALKVSEGASLGGTQVHERDRQARSDVRDPSTVDIEGARRALTGTIAGTGPTVDEVPPGRSKEPSLRVAGLRQQPYHRRVATAPVHGPDSNSSPLLTIGIHLGPAEEEERALPNSTAGPPLASVPPSAQKRKQQPPRTENGSSNRSFLDFKPGHRTGRPHARSWGGPQRSQEGQRSDSNVDCNRGSSNSLEVQRKGGSRAAAALTFMRSLGISRHPQSDGSVDMSSYPDKDGASSLDGWNAKKDTCTLETVNPPTIASSTRSSNLEVDEGSFPALRQPPRLRNDSDQGQATEAKRRGLLRGRLDRVFNTHHKGGCKDEEKCARVRRERQGTVAAEKSPLAPATSVLRPAGGVDGGFAFLPTVGGPLEISSTPDAIPEGARARSAPPGPFTSEYNVDAVCFVDDSTPSPSTPLGRSTRSFDPNFSPPEVPNMCLSPQLAGRPSLDSIPSFDANQSSRMWFDMSAESSQRPLDTSGENDIWKDFLQYQQSLQQQQQEHVERPLNRRRPLPQELSAVEREEKAAAAARALDAATAAADAAAECLVTTSASTSKDSTSASASGSVPPSVLFDEDQLVAELSDLSVSSGRRVRVRDQPMSPASAAAGNQRTMVTTSEGTSVKPVAVSTVAPAGTRDSALLHQCEDLVDGLTHTPSGSPSSSPPQEFVWRSNNGAGVAAANATNPSNGIMRDTPHGSTTYSGRPLLGVPFSTTAHVADEESRGTRNITSAAPASGAPLINGGLGLAPKCTPAPSGRVFKAESVDAELLHQKASEQDRLASNWGGNAGDSSRWWSASVVKNGLGAPAGGMRRCVTASPTPGLIAPPASPQRSISLDHSLSESRSSRRGSSGVDAVFGAASGSSVTVKPCDEVVRRAELVSCGAQPSLNGEHSDCAPPLSGAEQTAGKGGRPKSWSTLHAMIPVPVAPCKPTDRASIPAMSVPKASDIRRASDMSVCPGTGKDVTAGAIMVCGVDAEGGGVMLSAPRAE